MWGAKSWPMIQRHCHLLCNSLTRPSAMRLRRETIVERRSPLSKPFSNLSRVPTVCSPDSLTRLAHQTRSPDSTVAKSLNDVGTLHITTNSIIDKDTARMRKAADRSGYRYQGRLGTDREDQKRNQELSRRTSICHGQDRQQCQICRDRLSQLPKRKDWTRRYDGRTYPDRPR